MRKYWIIGLIVVVIILMVGFYVYKSQQNKEIQYQESQTTRLNGIFGYSNGNLDFSVGVDANGIVGGNFGEESGRYVNHFIKLTFSNQNEAIKMFDMDISKLPTDGWCSISGLSVTTIDVTGYNSIKAEKNWKDEVTLEKVVVPSASEVACAID
jgi:hypothetical protein